VRISISTRSSPPRCRAARFWNVRLMSGGQVCSVAVMKLAALTNASSDDLSIDKDQLSTTTEEACLNFLAVAVWRAVGDHPILAAPEIVVPEMLYSPPCPI
jgi:hypothetical protein